MKLININKRSWEQYLICLKDQTTNRPRSFDKYAGFEEKLAAIDTYMVDQILVDHISYHMNWIRRMRKVDGSPQDVAGTLSEKGFGGALSDVNQMSSEVAELKRKCNNVHAKLCEKYNAFFSELDGYGPLPKID